MSEEKQFKYETAIRIVNKYLDDIAPSANAYFRDPLYGKREEIIDNLFKYYNRRKQAKARINEDKKTEMTAFETAKKVYNQDLLKKYLVLNEQKTSMVPQDVKDAIVQLGFFDDIPIKNGIIYGSLSLINDYEKKGPFGETIKVPFYTRGELRPMTTKAFLEYTKARLGKSKKEVQNLPAYQMVRAYIRNKNFNKASEIIKRRAMRSVDPVFVAKKIFTKYKKKFDKFTDIESIDQSELIPEKKFNAQEVANINEKIKLKELDTTSVVPDSGKILGLIDSIGGVPIKQTTKLNELLEKAKLSGRSIKQKWLKNTSKKIE